MTPLRLTAVMTHPVQYIAPWFRYLAARHGADVSLTVLYGAIPSPAQQGTGFDRAFAWDVPLTDGYRFEVCADAAGKTFDSGDFFGIDVPDIGERIHRTRPDVVLVPGWHAAMQVRALRACRRRGVPVLYRGDSTLDSGPRRFVRPLWVLKTRLMLRHYDGYLAVGQRATEYLRAFDLPPERIHFSPHCVDHEAFAAAADGARANGDTGALRHACGADADDVVVLFAGKFQERKRPLDAVRAVAGLGPRAVLVMAGDGPLAAAARDEARRLGVRLAWRGFVNQSQLPRLYAAADAMLVPSTWESWGLIVNEALACGLPCVVTSGVAAAPDLIAGHQTGAVVGVGDIAAMTAALESLPARRDSAQADRCRARASLYSYDAATRGLLAGARAAVARSVQALPC
jgi:glycosyltransferase involved in cell wall biosynthesis